MCGSVRVWWSDQAKAAVKRKEDARKVLGDRDEDARESCLEVYKKKRERLKGAFIKVRRSSMNSLEGR